MSWILFSWGCWVGLILCSILVALDLVISGLLLVGVLALLPVCLFASVVFLLVCWLWWLFLCL